MSAKIGTAIPIVGLVVLLVVLVPGAARAKGKRATLMATNSIQTENAVAALPFDQLPVQ